MGSRTVQLIAAMLLGLGLLGLTAVAASATAPDDTWDLTFQPTDLVYDPATGVTLARSGVSEDMTYRGLDGDGTVLWTIANLEANEFAVSNGVVYISVFGDTPDSSLRAVDMATGTDIAEWTAPGQMRALHPTNASVWFEYSEVVDFSVTDSTIGRVDLASETLAFDVITEQDRSLNLDAVLPDERAAFVRLGSETLRYDLTGVEPVETHRVTHATPMLVDGASALLTRAAETIVLRDPDDLSVIRSIPDPDRFFRPFRELGDGLILGGAGGTSGRVAILDLRTGKFLGRALPRPVNYRGELYAVNGQVASVQNYSSRVEFHDLRHSTNASEIIDLESGPGKQIELTGDYLATVTSMSIGGSPVDFTINPAAAEYPGWPPRPASITVTVPDLGVGSHRVRVDGPLGPSLDNAENQLAIIPAKPRYDFEVTVRGDSAGEEALVSVDCAAPTTPAPTPDVSTNTTIRRGSKVVLRPVAGNTCVLWVQRNDTETPGWETHLSTGFYDPTTDPAGMRAIDLETYNVEFMMPSDDIGISIFLPAFDEQVLWTYAYGIGTPTAAERFVRLDCPNAADDVQYPIYYGNWVRNVVPRDSPCLAIHRTPAGAITSGFGSYEPNGSGRFEPPRQPSETTYYGGLQSTSLIVIYDIYPHPSEHNGAFVRQQYLDFLGRQGDSGGIANWENALNSGSRSRTDLVQLFLDSPEFGGTVAPINRLYQAYFDRAPDRGGLYFWIDWVRSGRTLTAVSNEFVRSAEFQRTYGALDDEAFIDLVYQNVLGRLPDAGGRAFWVDQMANGLTRGQLMLNFSESIEYVEQTRSAVTVDSLYQGLLQRSPDAGGFAFWTGQADAGAPLDQLIAGMLASTEYYNRFDNITEDLPRANQRLGSGPTNPNLQAWEN